MDNWIVWEAEEAAGAETWPGLNLFLFRSFQPFYTNLYKGSSHPEMCAQRNDEGGGFLTL
jgi:hypothetical protein